MSEDERKPRVRNRKKTSISLSGTFYARLKEYALKHNVAIATIVEKVLAVTLGHEPPVARPARRYRGPSRG